MSMQVEGTLPQERVARTSAVTRLWAIAIVVVVAILLLSTTQTHSAGDTSVYVGDLMHADAGQYSGVSPLWEFGHVLWRPAAWLLRPVVTPIVSGWSQGNKPSEYLATFVALNVTAVLVIAVLTADLALLAGSSLFGAVLLSAIVLCINPVLNYALTGTPYVVAFALQLIAVRFLLFRDTRSHPGPAAAGAIVSLALSVLVWFPFILTVPGIAVLARHREERRWQAGWGNVVLVVLGTVALVVLTYGAVALSQDMSVDQFVAWYRQASHGWDQNKKLLRLPSGLTRAFVVLENDGILLKRYMLRDPFAPVSAAQIFTGGLWKLVLVAAALAAFLAGLRKHPAKHGLYALLALNWLPILVFSVVLFEPGSQERMMPAFAASVVAAACLAGVWNLRDLAHQVVLAGFVVFSVLNYSAYFKQADMIEDVALRRIGSIRPVLRDGSRVILLSTTQDDIPRFYGRYLFHEETRLRPLPTYHLTEPGLRIEAPFAKFAEVALRSWQSGGDVWISRRLVEPRPDPRWNWIEGDNPSLPWKRIADYFRQFESAEIVGGQDGFFRLAPSSANREILAGTR